MRQQRGPFTPRPALEGALDGALTHRLTTVVAAAGYGKTTMLRHWADAVRGVYVPLTAADRGLHPLVTAIGSALRLRVPQLVAPPTTGPVGPAAAAGSSSGRAAALGTAFTEALAPALRTHLAIVLDDVDQLAGAPDAVQLVETLVRTAPPRLHVVLACQREAPFAIGRLRQQRDVLELDARHLALSEEEVSDWCEQAEVGGVQLAHALHASTGGWPALVRARIDAMSTAAPDERMRIAKAVAADDLEDLLAEALAELPGDVRWVLQAGTVLPLLDEDLVTALHGPVGALEHLAGHGLFLDQTDAGFRLSDTARAAVRRHAPLTPQDAEVIALAAVDLYAARHQCEHAVGTAIEVGLDDRLRVLLRTRGRELMDRPELLHEAIDSLPADLAADPVLIGLSGMAAHQQGDWDRAAMLLERALEAGSPDADLAWRLGFIHHMRGDFDDALRVYRVGEESRDPPGDAARCAALAAAAHWLNGDRDGCEALADEAMRRASAVGDAAALAASHTVVAMLAALDGDRRSNDAHYLRALEYAQEAGDVMQQIRIHANRGSHHHEEGAYEAALQELELAERLAEAGGYSWFLALTLSNRAETLTRLGRLDEARADAQQSEALWARLSSGLVSYPLAHLGHLAHLQGDAAGAVSAFERALAIAEDADLPHGIADSLAGLAEVHLGDDLDAARAAADRLLDMADGITGVRALTVAVRIAMASDDAAATTALLDQAEQLAIDRRDDPGRAAIVQLRAAAERSPQLAALAVTRWEQIGDPIGLADARLAQAELSDDAAFRAEVATAVEEAMTDIGCRYLDDRIHRLREHVDHTDDTDHTEDSAADGGSGPPAIPVVRIQTLGVFRVHRGGAIVSRTDWQSRKARELLKLLVTRRGQPTAKEEIAAILWPDDDPHDSTVLRRLNVQVSTLRSILDPGRLADPDHLIASADGSLRLVTDHATVDVEDFLGMVASAGQLARQGRSAEALRRWRSAESAHTGTFLAEDAYADWTVALREEVRMAYVSTVARLATAEAAAGDHRSAARLWHRLLATDPHDETAHLGLISALAHGGGHGDARRRYRMYAVRMAELGIEPAPFPDVG